LTVPERGGIGAAAVVPTVDTAASVLEAGVAAGPALAGGRASTAS
jgi:hypothetical protein